MKPTPATASPAGYMPSLDGLRALSILLVVGEHSPLERLVPFRLGFFGVDVFFVISGYLITSLLLGEQRVTGAIDLPRFYARRFLRIVPALWAWAIVLLVTRVDPPSSVLWSVLWVANFLIASGAMPSTGGAPVSWSLSMEEQFYALWPPIGKRFGPRGWAVAAVLGIAVVTAWRIVLVGRGVTGFPRLSARPDAHFDVILWGCLAAVVEAASWFPSVAARVRERRGLVLAGLAAAAAGTWLVCDGSDANVGRAGFTLVAVLTAAFILWLRVAPDSRTALVLSLGPVVFIGKISYGIYLWHRPAIYWLYDPAVPGLTAFGAGWPVWARGVLLGAWFAGAILLWSSVSWFAIERPFLRMKKRFEVRRSLPVESATGATTT